MSVVLGAQLPPERDGALCRLSGQGERLFDANQLTGVELPGGGISHTSPSALERRVSSA